MTTEARARTNRENARKSTGPKTEAGKARCRLNALKHGRRSKAVAAPVLPQEDAAELGRRIQDWIESYQAVGAVEIDLVTRAAKASWALDRAERHETALLARRVRRAVVSARARRAAKVCDLGRKLLYMAGRRIVPGSGPDWADDPAAFVAELKTIPEGAGWLRDRWGEIRCLILADEPWTYLDQFKFIRLMGKQPFDGIDDPALNAVFLAWEAIEEGWGVRFWKMMQEHTPYDDPAFSAWRLWRAIAPRPADKESGVAHLLAVVAAEIERLDARIAELEAADGDDAVETAERASFSPGDDAERLRRFQACRSRELMRTLDTLNRLRKEAAAREKDKEKDRDKKPAKPPAGKPGPASPPCPPPSAIDPDDRPEASTTHEPEPRPAPTPAPEPVPVETPETPAPGAAEHVAAEPAPAPAVRRKPAARKSTAPATRPAPVAVAIDPDEALPAFRVDPAFGDSLAPYGPDSAAIRLLSGSRRAVSRANRANEAKATAAKVVSREELAWSRCNPFPRERTQPADPGLRRKVEAACSGLGKKKADGPRGLLSCRRPGDGSCSGESVSSASAASERTATRQASRSRC
ncbi:hypothetical protein [Paludisphaera sp.]|uniref:hypothetical protein n=1 Tax=Paludisphaera sp. TaxID=2017432 RepID=UPI00301CB7A0